MPKDCVFCKIAGREIKTEIVEESQNFVAFPDARPVVKGHTLIIPKRHFNNLMDLPADLGSELLSVIKKIAEKRIKEGAKGFNLVMNNFSEAGQVVMHSHVHLIPRKEGDGIRIIG